MRKSTEGRRSGHPSTWPSRAVVSGLLAGLLTMTAACSGNDDSGGGNGSDAASQGQDDSSDVPTVQLQEATGPVTVVGADNASAAALSAEVSQALFVSSPAVVVASTGDQEGVRQGAEQAAELGIPMLLLPGAQSAGTEGSADDAAATSEGPDDSSQSAGPADLEVSVAEIERLEAETVLAMSPAAEEALDDAADVDIVTARDDLPELQAGDGNGDLAVLVPSDARDAEEAAAGTAAMASAKAAGAEVIPVAGPDLRADADAVESLADQGPARVLAVGSQFGPAETLSGRVEVAKTGVQLPGGGQAIFPGRRLVALYGTPGTPGLGVLGEQDLDASITRAEQIASDFDPLSDVTVVPTFEIIATIAQASAGADGDYSGEIGVQELRPWVKKAGEEGVYVVLDLQPGRANFLDQAKIYEDLLRMPHVGLALDPEWRLTPTQQPLGQIGSVEAEEVNSVITWLADLTKEEKLPQKLLVLHQFRISMLQDEDEIDLGRDEVQVLIHMDGQGSPDLKDGTWQAVKAAAPEGVPFGWKNFFDEDQPMLSPEQTMDKEPAPLMISYQ